MKMRVLAIISLGLAAPISTGAYAQWTGPSDTQQATKPAYAATNISTIKANPKDDQKVSLTGTLVRKTHHEHYLFSDGSGEIIIDIDDKLFPNQQVNEKTKIRVDGEVDTHRKRDPHIEAERIAIVN